MTAALVRRILTVFTLLTLLAATAAAQPSRIILLRHAEKPVNDAEIHLSDRGRQRALALEGWSTNSPVWGTNERPVAVFACKPTVKAPSRRSVETITPLAAQLKLPVQTPFPAKNPDALAHQILTDPALNGKTVVICWARDEIPQLAGCLGIKSNDLKWHKNVFDRVWLITFQDSTAVLSDLPQHVLTGDAEK